MDFSESDLQASASAYNPALHEAPIVVGHPKADAPAYGWVKSLSFADGLEAEPHQVDEAFSELVQAGRYKKISASFYTPDAPTNPVPGVYYLRHVGFLGAQPPAVKGLKPVEFSESDECIEFSDWDDMTNATLWRNLREFFISKFGIAVADETIPGESVGQLEQSAQEELAKPEESQPINYQENTMTPEDQARLEALEAENKLLKQQQADFAEAEKARKTASIHADNLAYAESLVKAGTLLPAQKDVTVATLDFLASQEQVVEFGEGDSKKPLIDSVKELFKGLPKQIEFSEVSQETGNIDLTGSDASSAQHKQKWNSSAELRAEFGEFDTYVAFAKAENNGLVKIKG